MNTRGSNNDTETARHDGRASRRDRILAADREEGTAGVGKIRLRRGAHPDV
mgnify:CR=1 FL=1